MGMLCVTNQHFTELTKHEGCEESHKIKQGDRLMVKRNRVARQFFMRQVVDISGLTEGLHPRLFRWISEP